MLEYLYDAIRANAGQPLGITAQLANNGEPIIEDCVLVFFDDNQELTHVEGLYIAEIDRWNFTVPAEVTEGRIGRHWYCIRHDGVNLCLNKPIYLV